jgi:hypothetical protein
MRIGVVEVAACETPPTLCDRRVECLIPGKPHVWRARSLLDRHIDEVIWGPLSQDFSNAYVGENTNTHSILPRCKLCCVVRQYAFGTIVDTLRLTLVCIWNTGALRGEGDQLVGGSVNNHKGRLRLNALDPVARWGANLVD